MIGASITLRTFTRKQKSQVKRLETFVVPGTGLEPARLAAHGPKPCVYANSTTPARLRPRALCQIKRF